MIDDDHLDQMTDKIMQIFDRFLVNTDPSPDQLCHCGEPAIHAVVGRVRGAWCHQHAPRCRSGAHFFNNCVCQGVSRTRDALRYGECL